MAPEPPDIPGLFTDYGTKEPIMITNLKLWYNSHIRKKLITRECLVTNIRWYKGRKNVQHEFLRFDISSPDKVHTAILTAERGAGESSKGGDRLPGIAEHTGTTTPPVNPTDSVIGPSIPPVTTTPPLASPDVTSDSTGSSADETSPNIARGKSTATKKKPKAERSSTNASSSSNIISRRSARDAISHATLDSTASAELERKCEVFECITTLTFPENAGPSADKIATLLLVTSTLEPTYQLMHTQCYWFVATVFEASKRLFPGAEQDITKHNGGRCYRIRIPQKSSVDAVCEKYKTAQTALDAEIEEDRRVEREDEEARRRDIEQRQAAEEAAKREREQRLAAEEAAKRDREQRQAAEEAAKRDCEQRQAAEEAAKRDREQRQAAEEAAKRDREQRQAAEERARAAEEKIANLLRQMEASGAGASTGQA
ncbi:hypothetical protein BKA83DRAFT_4326805 [Pisolithus microcarpus]|nr:hypothetical protein BKA83DRAFT_4326805 [Pisolithus microcarpus]